MSRLVGVDETGRGSCIGPLFVAAAVVDPAKIDPKLVTDSKKLKGKRLDAAYDHVRSVVTAYAVEQADLAEIAEHNITGATKRAWRRALDRIDPALYDEVIVDGIVFEPYTDPTGAPRRHRCEPKADGNYACVSAASILAKVERDRHIRALCDAHPELDERYGIRKNVGYLTKQHTAGLVQHGLSAWHRTTYHYRCLDGGSAEK